jgi:triacylglycerol esterase/lipase EstA (alpha/beta hydrolase family)
MAKHEGSSCGVVKGLSCRIYATLAPGVDTAIIFVHGFHGDQEKTWRTFQKLIDQYEEFNSWDAYFVGYRSTREQIAATAYNLSRFIERIYPRPPSEIFQRVVPNTSTTIRLRDDVTEYTRLVLVGHSQGGAVIRKAVLETAKEALRTGTVETDPICHAELALFAPALFGMFLSGFKGFAAATAAWKVVGPVLSGSPSYKELQPNSKFLARLENETVQLASQNHEKVAALAARIAWAARDKIVQGGQRYQCDPKYIFFDQDHSGICKPDANYRDPLLFILGQQLD